MQAGSGAKVRWEMRDQERGCTGENCYALMSTKESVGYRSAVSVSAGRFSCP